MQVKRLGGLALGAALLFTTGCYDITQLIKLNPDLSGEATLKIIVDMEAMVKVMATMERKFSGKEGPPTAEEMDKARQEFLKKNEEEKQQNDEEFAQKRKQLEEKLPKGVTLKDIGMKHEGLKLEVGMTFGFDHVAKLKDIEFPADQAEGEEGMEGGGMEPGPGGEQPLQRPFEGLVVEETADTLRIQAKPANPAKEQDQGGGEGGEGMGEGEGMGGEDDGMKEMVRGALGSLKVTFRIESPLAVEKHNATKQDGTNLIWTYDLERLEKLEKAGEKPENVDVTFKKK